MIILDTNFLIYIMKYKLAHDIEEHINQLAVPVQVINELKTLAKNAEKTADRQAANLALMLLEKWKVKIIEEEGVADEAIARMALKNRAKVATLDKILGLKLKKNGISLLKIRQKKHIVED